MRPTACTFDCSGPRVDWEGGLGTFLYSLALARGDADPPPGRALRERWEAIQFEVIRGESRPDKEGAAAPGRARPYKEALAEALRAWCSEPGYSYDAADGEALVRAMRSWRPCPDTRPALM